MSTIEIEANELPGLLQQPQKFMIDGVPVIAAPPGWSVESQERHLLNPRKIVAALVANDARGLIDYVLKHKSPETTIYAGSKESPCLIARIDDNVQSEPSHIKHTIKFDCPHTTEWTRWIRHNDKAMGQVAFAEFIEDNIASIIEPSGQELLSACLTFQESGSAKFRSAIRLTDGRIQFKYEEEDTNGEAKFPERLVLAIPVFEGAPDSYRLTAKLRYRIDRDTGLHLRYIIDRPDLTLKSAYEDLITDVSSATGVQVIRAI